MAITRTSIVGPRERRLSPRETAAFKGCLTGSTSVTNGQAVTYKQMVNGVNTGAVWHVVRKHAERDGDILKHTEEGQSLLAAAAYAPLSPDDRLKKMTPQPYLGVNALDANFATIYPDSTPQRGPSLR